MQIWEYCLIRIETEDPINGLLTDDVEGVSQKASNAAIYYLLPNCENRRFGKHDSECINLIMLLNYLGAEGWEVFNFDKFGERENIIYLKRPQE